MEVTNEILNALKSYPTEFVFAKVVFFWLKAFSWKSMK